jgi:4-oxalmesaconate hydratase
MQPEPGPERRALDGATADRRYWYPFYEAMVELDVPAMVHVSAVTNPNFHATGSHYLNADTTAFMQFLQADLFADFPGLRLVIPHGGGAVPFHWGVSAGSPTCSAGRRSTNRSCATSSSTRASTTSRHRPAVRGRRRRQHPVRLGDARRRPRDRPAHRHHFDDTRRYVDALGLDPTDRAKVYEGNARRVYPRVGGPAVTLVPGVQTLRAGARLPRLPR